MLKRLLRATLLFQAALLLGCDGGGIEWDAPVPLPAALSQTALLVFDAQGDLAPRVAPAYSPPPSVDGRDCVSTLRVARDTVGDWYAVWWRMRADSTADVVVARSTDGVMWNPAVRVDTSDAAAVGCGRPPPSITVDGGNVYVTYAMAAREGPGIFASHSMDSGTMFHSPVPVVYGEAIGLTAVAARGDVVAVAFEDPNSTPRRIGLALSRTMGHIFERREIVSPPTGAARVPGVALGDGVVVVTWMAATGADTSRAGPRMMRRGVIR